MRFTVDASVAVKWFLDEADSHLATRLAGSSLFAPRLMMVEFANTFWVKVRRREVSTEEARDCIQVLRRAPIRWIADPSLEAEAFDLAVRLSHPVYDCLYLAVAIEHSAPVVTADQKLFREVRREPTLGHHVVPLAEIPSVLGR